MYNLFFFPFSFFKLWKQNVWWLKQRTWVLFLLFSEMKNITVSECFVDKKSVKIFWLPISVTPFFLVFYFILFLIIKIWMAIYLKREHALDSVLGFFQLSWAYLSSYKDLFWNIKSLLLVLAVYVILKYSVNTHILLILGTSHACTRVYIYIHT